jgi:hydrogenase maturation protease
LGATEQAVPSYVRQNRTLILGMGNPILGDDGVGVRVAERLRGELSADSGVDVSEACVGGLSLMERMVGYEKVILVDALCKEPVNPGAVRKLSLNDLRIMGCTQHIVSAHDTNLITALEAGRRMSLPLPKNVVIYAVEAAHVLDFGEELTPEVADAVPRVVRAVLEEVACSVIESDSTEGRKPDGIT